MTIHSDHPFVPPEPERDPLRRFRGRLPAPVTIWTTGESRRRAGLTVSSMLVADGDPAHVLALVDEDADFTDAVLASRSLAVSVLAWEHRALGDAFAGAAPAPGGPFTLGSWVSTPWGPVLDDAVAWLGGRLVDGEPKHAGWALLLDAVVEQVEIPPTGRSDPLVHLRGRYVRP